MNALKPLKCVFSEQGSSYQGQISFAYVSWIEKKNFIFTEIHNFQLNVNYVIQSVSGIFGHAYPGYGSLIFITS